MTTTRNKIGTRDEIGETHDKIGSELKQALREDLGVDRRQFMGLMGASLALAGVSLPGCVRKPQEKIFPYAKRPEDLIPGNPRYFATSMQSGAEVLGLVVESQDGRPTKIEGNDLHPANAGKAHSWAQASVLGLYDHDRAKKPRYRNAEIPYKAAVRLLNDYGNTERNLSGESLALLVEYSQSPTFRAMLAEVRKAFPSARLYVHDAAYPANWFAGAELAGVQQRLRPLHSLDRARVILALDADPLGHEGDTLRNARLYAAGREVRTTKDTMNRLYAVEPSFTITGGAADHRLPLPASKIGDFLAALVLRLLKAGVNAPEGAESLVSSLRNLGDPLAGDPVGDRKPGLSKWLDALASDLRRNRKRSLVLVGERQAPRVHALGLLLNQMLGNVGRGRPLQLVADEGWPADVGDLPALVERLEAGKVRTLLMLGGNPVYTGGAELGLAKAIGRAKISVHASEHVNETSERARLHLPLAHYLEAWGDLRSTDGTLSLQQPLIAPLYGAPSAIEILAMLLGDTRPRGYDLVLSRWCPGSEVTAAWRYALHDGRLRRKANPVEATFAWAALATAWGKAKPVAWPAKGRLEATFQLDWSVYDGRHGHITWMHEAPDPFTKLAWDNPALISPRTAKALGLESGQMCELTLDGRGLTMPVFVTPGVAESAVILPLGYGREVAPRQCKGVGFNAYVLRASAAGFSAGLGLKRARGSYPLHSVQDYGSLTPDTEERPGLGPDPKKALFPRRTMVREGTIDKYRADPKFVLKDEVMPAHKLKSLWTEPHPRDGHQWGMCIDLNACIGCGACSLACQAENNIPVVGKERIGQGREMHWIRVDRYFEGDETAPRVLHQPMPCQQCENAPCEQVCPVAATAHSPEGLNDMAYNRCIGTRYCSNNCPYKVRRFNYFNFQKENRTSNPLLTMQRNPDVTVRFRGVMEKCTYCVQRIQQAKIATRRHDSDRIPDGAVVPACVQTCPTAAISFGDLNLEGSLVNRRKREGRNYMMIAELNSKPRTSYLAKLHNPHPSLAEPSLAKEPTSSPAPAGGHPPGSQSPGEAGGKKG